MRLFVDIGNTAAKWASEEELLADIVQKTDTGDPVDSMLSAWKRLDQPCEVYISSVLQADGNRRIMEWVSGNWRITPCLAESKASELGVTNGYREPSQLGVDRWLAMLAARAISKAALVVVDCGSATTLDGVDADGKHLGGVILPGLHLIPRCLFANTEIPLFDSSGKINYFATDTATGIHSGAMLATASSVERMVEMLQKESGTPVECLVTGGGSHFLSENLRVDHRLAPNLVLHGLALIAGKVD
ncbi:MAG: type III pantothenate kinase [Candidatus Thiodiazotropha sp. (ex Monitilora ramsayi)]|nr:type III pantothenate kinase [Candidatus Thiodiazotropha sp. (ex Monitilora ramsayi)]